MAAQVRAQAGLPNGPIPNLTELLERLGVLIVVRDLGSRRLDAVGQWPEGRRPLFLVNSAAPADRRRFTSAHELGHAVLHTAPTDDHEQEADAFAAALLMPAEDGHKVLHDIDLPSLARLKAAWGMSMAALLRRAHDLGHVNDYRYRQLNMELAAAGYRTSEPVELAPERPTTITDVIKRLQSAGQTVADLAAHARMTIDEFQDLYLEAAA
jgi:Zn-dependent peptidase ImmA (M78 family)